MGRATQHRFLRRVLTEAPWQQLGLLSTLVGLCSGSPAVMPVPPGPPSPPSARSCIEVPYSGEIPATPPSPCAALRDNETASPSSIPTPADGNDLLYYVNRTRSIPASYPIPEGSAWTPCVGGSPGTAHDLVCLPASYTSAPAALRRTAFVSPAPPTPTRTFDDQPVGHDGRIGFQAFLDAARAEAGHSLYIRSGFRSYATQSATFLNWIRLEQVRGFPRDEAIRRVSAYSARPGHSEHQLGTTVDLTYREPNGRLYPDWNEETMGENPAMQWALRNAHRFGIALTYGRDKVSVTGYQWEPWHFRFVGVEAADFMRRCDLSTEEYLQRRYGAASVLP